MLRAEHDRPPQVKSDRPPPPQPGRVARRVPKRRRVTRRAPKRCRLAKGVANYIHPADKCLFLRTKLRAARLRDEGLVGAKMADFMHKALPAYTAANIRLNTKSSNKSLIRL
jgi:hypothetical protein